MYLFVVLLDIIAEKIRHVADVLARPVSPFDHRELRTGIEGVEQEVRIDLRLKILELGILEVVLHEKALLLHGTLRDHLLSYFRDVLLNAREHLVECARNVADLVVGVDLEGLDVFEATPRDLVRLVGQARKWPGDGAGKEDDEKDVHERDDNEDRQTQDLRIPERCDQRVEALGVDAERLVVEAVDVCVQHVVHLGALFVVLGVFLDVASALCLDGVLRCQQIGLGELADVALAELIDIVRRKVVELLYLDGHFLRIFIVKLEVIGTLRLEEARKTSLYLRKIIGQIVQADVGRIDRVDP